MSVRTEYHPGEFSWVDLAAHDMPAARSFYEQFFSWTSRNMDTDGGPPYAQFQRDGHSVAGLSQMSEEIKSHGVPASWNSYISVADVDATVTRAAELGASITVPVMQVLEYGWMAFLQDPTGALVGLWQPNNHFGAELVNDPGAFSWNELATRETAVARDFYGQLLGWEFEESSDTPHNYYIIRHRGGMNGGLLETTQEMGDLPTCWSVYFTVEDTDQALEKLVQLSGRLITQPFDVPAGRIAVVSDPQGAMFNLIQLSGPPD